MRRRRLSALALAVVFLFLLLLLWPMDSVEAAKKKTKTKTKTKTKKSKESSGGLLFNSETLKCLVCESLAEEFKAEIQKIDPKKMVSTGTFRVDGQGNQDRSVVRSNEPSFPSPSLGANFKNLPQRRVF